MQPRALFLILVALALALVLNLSLVLDLTLGLTLGLVHALDLGLVLINKLQKATATLAPHPSQAVSLKKI